MRSRIFVLLAFFSACAAGLAQQVGGIGDVPVSFCADVDWHATNVPSSAANGTATLECDALASTQPLSNCQTVLTRGSTSTTFSTTQRINTRFVPGVLYHVTLSVDAGFNPTDPAYMSLWQNGGPNGVYDATLHVSAPPGYSIMVQPTTMSAFLPSEQSYVYLTNTVENNYMSFAVMVNGPTSNPGVAAGMATSISPDRIMWQLSLGTVLNGNAAGCITFDNIVGIPDLATMFSAGKLACDASASEVLQMSDSVGLRQVLAPQVCVDIQTSSSPLVIKCYHPSQRSSSTDPNTGFYTFSGSPFTTYTVQSLGSDSAGVQISCAILDVATQSTVRTLVTKVWRTGTGPNFSWTAEQWHDQSVGALAKVLKVRSGSTETVSIQDAGGTTAMQTTRTYTSMALGEEIASLQTGTVNSNTTSYTYYANDTTDAQTAAYGKVKLVTTTSGSWHGFSYDANGHLANTFGPFGNTAAPSSLPTTSGVVQAMTYETDDYGAYTRLGNVSTAINGTAAGKSSITYVAESPYTNYGHSSVLLADATRIDNTDATHTLTSYSKSFSESVGAGNNPKTDDYFAGQSYSNQDPTGVKVVYAYQRGTWDGTTFTTSGNGGLDATMSGGTTALAGRITVINGTGTTPPAGVTYTTLTSYGGAPIESINVIDGQSTASVTIRDSYARVARVESYVWLNAAWNLVGWTNYSYNTANQLTARSTSNGTSYSASYSGERLASETNESGITVSYAYDNADRVSSSTQAAAGSIPALTTTFTYDAAGDVTQQVVGTGGSETITSSKTYDDSGRVLTDSNPGPAGAVTTSYSYNVAANSTTVTMSNGGTRTDTSQLDGTLASVTGNAVVPEYYTYSIPLSDGIRYTRVNLLTSTGARLRETWTDWAGRNVKSSRPGFANQTSYVEQPTYDSTTGLTTKLSRVDGNGNKLFADTLYQYDLLGRANRSGADINANGSLDLVSNDRIGDLNQYFESYNGSIWSTKKATTYPTANSSTGLVTSIERQRLTGLGGAYSGAAGVSGVLAAEKLVTDINGNTVDQVTVINAPVATTTVVTTSSIATNAAKQVSVNGFVTSTTGMDGATQTLTYDALHRQSTVSNPRTNTVATTSYYSGTTFVSTATDTANNTVATYTYDTAGRVIIVKNAAGKYARNDYNLLNQVVHQWGDTVDPTESVYDGYGQRTELHTYQTGTWTATSWPTGVTPSGVTKWTYDDPTGLVSAKSDNVNPAVTFTYNARGQTATRVWSRGLITTYGYDSNTGELLTTSYSDSTPTVTLSFNRAGFVATAQQSGSVADSRTFNYDGAIPVQLDSISLDASFYGGRTLTRQYDAYHRPTGFSLGSEVVQTYGYEGATSRFSTLDTSSAASSAAHHFTYGYAANSSLVASISVLNGTGTGGASSSFSVNRGYDAQRDLLTAIDSLWSTASQTRYDYTYNALGQRASMKQSGAIFGDFYSGSTTAATYSYVYNDRGELVDAADYLGTDTTQSGNQLSDRHFAYAYDAIGNRQTSSRNGAAGTADSYSTNSLNQYTSRTNTYARTTGTVSSSTTSVTSSGGGLGWVTGKQGRYWAADAQLSGSNPSVVPLTVKATIAGGGTGGADLVYTDTSHVAYLPPAAQSFSYDADGNLTSDGLWTYTYDGENRLVTMTTSSIAATAGFSNQTLTFRYDYLGRRVQKTVATWNGSMYAFTSAHRYLYDGDNIIAEYDTSNSGSSISTLLRSFTWGLDLAGSLSATAGVGALLQIADHVTNSTYFTTYDANGNVASLLNASTGAVAAAYEYSPSGELLRCSGSYAKSNPFRFSSKFTDDESGLVYYGARYYSPSLGRFINRDPIAEAGGLNLYGFCGNDGVDHWDVRGNSWLSKLWNRTIGSLGRHIAMNWDHGRQYIELAAAIVVSIWVGWEVADWVYEANAVEFATTTAADIAAGQLGAVTVTANAGVLGSAVGTSLTGQILATTAAGIAGGAAGGAVSGGILSGSLSGALRGAEKGAIAGGISGFIKGMADVGTELAKYSHLHPHIDQLNPDGSYTLSEEVDPSTIVGKQNVSVNGLCNKLEEAAKNGENFYKGQSFVLDYSPTYGLLPDIAEAAVEKLTGVSSEGNDLAALLEHIDPKGSTLYMHSRGMLVGGDALRKVIDDGAMLNGLSVGGYGGAANIATIQHLTSVLGANGGGLTVNAFDLVPNIVGGDAIFAPWRAITSLVAAPLLFGPGKTSPHSSLTGSGQTFWSFFNTTY